jgi:ABC-type glycerol-3-phosphate transport system substrate-binding protein
MSGERPAGQSGTNSSNDSNGRLIHRRRFVKAVGATGVAAGLAGCSGGDGGDGGSEGSGGNGETDSSGESGSEGGADGGGTKTGESGGSAGTTTIQFVTHNQLVENVDTFNQYLHEHGMSDDIEVKTISAGQVTDDMQSKYRQWLSSGRKTPDMLTVDSGWTIPFIVRGQLLNLDDTLPGELVDRIKSDFFDSIVKSAADPNTGELYGAPIYPGWPTIQYRKDLVSDAGYDWQQYETEAMSWKQFSNELKDVYEQSDVEYGFNWQATAAEQLSCCVFNEYYSTFGGAIFGNPEENLYANVGERPVTIDEQPVIDSLRMARTFVYGKDDEYSLDGYAGNISPKGVLQWDVEPSRKPFTSGNAVALRNWTYSINISGSEGNLGEDQGVMPMPYGVPEGEGKYPGTGGSIGALGGWHYSINPNSERIDACVEMIEAAMQKEFQKKLFGLTGWMPPDPEVLSGSTDVPIMGRHVETLSWQGKHTMPRPVTVLWPQESEKIEQQANAALSEGTSPSDAMGRLKSQLTAIEESYEG